MSFFSNIFIILKFCVGITHATRQACLYVVFFFFSILHVHAFNSSTLSQFVYFLLIMQKSYTIFNNMHHTPIYLCRFIFRYRFQSVFQVNTCFILIMRLFYELQWFYKNVQSVDKKKTHETDMYEVLETRQKNLINVQFISL